MVAIVVNTSIQIIVVVKVTPNAACKLALYRNQPHATSPFTTILINHAMLIDIVFNRLFVCIALISPKAHPVCIWVAFCL